MNQAPYNEPMINANLTNAITLNLTCAACGEPFTDALFINGQWICGRHYGGEQENTSAENAGEPQRALEAASMLSGRL